MSELDWHNITDAEADGLGYEYILDVSQDVIPDQAAEYNGKAIVRTTKPGWSWYARFSPKPKDRKDKRSYSYDIGQAETKEQALADGLKALNRLMLRNPGQ